MATDITPPPYRFGVDDVGGAVGGENDLPTPENPEAAAPADPVRSEGEFRLAVLTLLAEIRDALLDLTLTIED